MRHLPMLLIAASTLASQWLGLATESCAAAGQALPHFHALIQRASGLRRQNIHIYDDAEWDDKSILFHEGCPWLYETAGSGCPQHSPCTRRLECRLSRPLRMGAFAVPAVSLVLALLVMMRSGKDSKAAQPIDWHLNRLPCGLTPLVRRWFATGVFPPSVAANGAPEVTVALYLVGLLGWLLLMHSVKYTQPTPLDVPEYLGFLAEACRKGLENCSPGSSPAKAGFKVFQNADGQLRLHLPYPTSLLLGQRLLPLAASSSPTFEGAEVLAAVRLATFAGMLTTIFALLLSRLSSGSTVFILRTTAAVGSSIFCLGFGALEAAVRWHGHLWIAPVFANVGIAIFCIFLAAGVDATHFLARWAFYCTLVPLYFTAGAHKLKVGGLHWNACDQMGHWAKDEFHWNVPLPDFTRFIITRKYICLVLTVSTLVLQLGLGLAEALPWLVRPLLPLAALGFHLGVWFLMHICFGGHFWVWCLCVDVLQPALRLCSGPGSTAQAKPPPKPELSGESSDDDEAVADEPQSVQCSPECSDSDQGSTAMQPKAAAAAAACTLFSLAVAARGLASAWVPSEDSDQWPFTSMDMFA